MIDSPNVPSARPHPYDALNSERRVLFLDDDPRRAELFLIRCPEAVWVTRAEDCITRLEEPWDEVHLDHDLNGEQYVDVMRDDCGMAVVRWLCDRERDEVRDARFYVHSHNFAAASLMVECLLRNGYAAEYRPFGYDLVDFLSFGPPPTPLPRGVWHRLIDRISRLFHRRDRMTRALGSRYDVGDSQDEGRQADQIDSMEERF